ncbi:hypothetical protein HBH51_015960 [Parastagonospora nodorum]|nr:hypothetical protein HBH51_015960 [Parastagonospora nodorum]
MTEVTLNPVEWFSSNSLVSKSKARPDVFRWNKAVSCTAISHVQGQHKSCVFYVDARSLHGSWTFSLKWGLFPERKVR